MGDEGDFPEDDWAIDAGQATGSPPAGEKKAGDGASTARTWWQPLVAVTAYLALFVGGGYVAIVVLGWPSERHATAWSAWATVAAGMVVAWYTWETHKLRLTSQAQVAATLRQTEVQLRPFVVVRRTDEPGVFALENVGQAVALNVRVGNVVVGKIGDRSVSIVFPDTVPVLRAGRRRKVRTQALVGTRLTDDTAILSAHLDEDYTKQTLTVRVECENVEGRTYAVPVTIAPRRATVGGVQEGARGPGAR